MSLQYEGLQEISGPLIVVDHVHDVANEEMVRIMVNKENRLGRVVQIEGDRAIIQVFEGCNELSLQNTRLRFLKHPMEISLSKEILGRVFDGAARVIDGMGEIYADHKMDINGEPMNPISRVYPKNYISTGISSIDALTTLIRGQKLPIFSGSGLPHNELAVQLVRQAKLADKENQNFAIVFAAMGVKNEVADYFTRSFEEAGVMDRVVMFLNLSDDPIVERIMTPKCALSAAEYLAFHHDMHILVIMSDMTSYCEALREFSSSKGEIPGRKGYPGYLYSDLASLYERAGIIKGAKGSVTQIPILSMPNDDITHPIPDLTGYITEGQIVLDRELTQKGIYPPISVLPSLSRLMKDGIGAGFTREDHNDVSNQLFASYAKVQDARSLASVIGEDELSKEDKEIMNFGRMFENYFINQGNSARSIDETLDLGWDLLSLLPKESLDRIDQRVIDKHYDQERAMKRFHIQKKGILQQMNEWGS